MQFNDIRFDDNGIISFLIDNDSERKYNPFLVAYQAMVGAHILDDYKVCAGNLIPGFVPIRFLKEAEITSDMENAMKWLISNYDCQEDKYFWRYNYPVVYGRQKMAEGWVSAYGQAYVALAMLFFYIKTQDTIYSNYAIGAIRGLITKMEEGGCANKIGNGQVWFEEIPSENATHIFNAHLISIITLFIAKDYLKLEELSDILESAMNALKNKIEWMDTGTMSAYDMPDSINFQLQLDGKNISDKLFIGEITLDDGISISRIDMKSKHCFEEGRCFASGIDWSGRISFNGLRRVINGHKIHKNKLESGTQQNTYFFFSDISTNQSVLEMTIEYFVDKDTRIILKKNCGAEGFQSIGMSGEFVLLAGKGRRKLYIPTRSLLPHLSMIYHQYHIELLEEILSFYNDNKIRRVVNNFKRYVDTRDDFDTEPQLTSLSVCLNSQCGLFCKMCDLGIKNKEASIYKFLRGGGRDNKSRIGF